MKEHPESEEWSRETSPPDPSELSAPMGVSDWQKHGEQYGYWDFFEEKIRADERAKIRAWAFDHILLNVPKEETMVRGYDKAFKEMVAFLDSLDSPQE